MKSNAYNFSNDLARIGSALSRAMLGNASDDANIALGKYRDAQTEGQNQENTFRKGQFDAIDTASAPTGMLSQSVLNSQGIGLDKNNNFIKLQPPGVEKTVPAYANQETMAQADMLAQAGAMARAIFGDGKYSPNQLTEALGDLSANRDSNMARSMILDPATAEKMLRRAGIVLNQDQYVNMDNNTADNIAAGQRNAADNTQSGLNNAANNTQSGLNNAANNTQSGLNNAADNTAAGERNTADNIASGERNAADNTAAGERNTADNTASGERNAADNVASGERNAADNIAAGERNDADNTAAANKPGVDFAVSPSDDTALRDFVDEADTKNVIDGMSNAATIVNQLVNASVSAMGAKKSIPKAKAFITQKLSRGFTEFKVPNSGVIYDDKFNVPNFLLDELNATTGNVENDKAISALKTNEPDKFLNEITKLFNQYGFSAEQIAIILG